MEIKVLIDQIENDRAYLIAEEPRCSFILPLKTLPDGCREGDFLKLSIKLLKKETQKGIKQTKELIAKLAKKEEAEK